MNVAIVLTSLLTSVCRGCTCGHIPGSPVGQVADWLLENCSPEEMIAVELVALTLAEKEGLHLHAHDTLFNYGREAYKGAPFFREGRCFNLEFVIMAISIVKKHGFPVRWVREMKERHLQEEGGS